MHSRPDGQPATESPAATTTPNGTPRETLRGDRLCVRCLQPLVGRTIEREPSTGLLFVRCGECGTASALLEYPTLAPWMQRLRIVVASSLAIAALVVAMGVGALCGIVTGALASIASSEAGRALANAWAEATKAGPDPQGFGYSGWSTADLAWLSTDAGQDALAASMYSPDALEPALLIGTFATLGLTVGALGLGGLLLRRRAIERAILATLPAILGASVGSFILRTTLGITRGPSPTWSSVAEFELSGSFALATAAWLVTWTALCALAAPSVVAFVARTVLPPSDRRLVAWIWEWRGKPVPRD